ncbi:MAG: cytochrome b/b6 domain-containing protein [Thiocapsa sp.]|nr:cytochrome b/b6 domain-containing protein [Thiocapsa sp.]MCG6897773.1 cytochrome b/b6 domain-containing protein [Thiocapsa sp.]MCG6986292.1 cytochrome b/b6 domain-containing protein [Thiocapsa sp.]
MSERRVLVWDLPTRLFHWILALLVVAAFVTGLQGGGLMEWHGRIGLLILGLLAFRLAWGVLGSSYARFGQFVRGPSAVVAYLRGRWHGLGHSPLAALSVLALLATLLLQALTGLVANDDIAFTGPLYELVSAAASDRLSGLHRQNAWLIGTLVGLHLCAILVYTFLRKDDLIRPMIHGYRNAPSETATSATGGGWLAFLVALSVAVAAVWIGDGGLLPPAPAPPPPGTIPTW